MKGCNGNPNVNYINQPEECMYCEYWEDGCLKIGVPVKSKSKLWTGKRFLIELFIIVVFIGVASYQLDREMKSNPQPPQVEQLYAEVQQLQADNKKLTERVDANDAIVNRWLMEGGGRP